MDRCACETFSHIKWLFFWRSPAKHQLNKTIESQSTNINTHTRYDNVIMRTVGPNLGMVGCLLCAPFFAVAVLLKKNSILSSKIVHTERHSEWLRLKNIKYIERKPRRVKVNSERKAKKEKRKFYENWQKKYARDNFSNKLPSIWLYSSIQCVLSMSVSILNVVASLFWIA